MIVVVEVYFECGEVFFCYCVVVVDDFLWCDVIFFGVDDDCGVVFV